VKHFRNRIYFAETYPIIGATLAVALLVFPDIIFLLGRRKTCPYRMTPIEFPH
jgi:hypothetical protein